MMARFTDSQKQERREQILAAARGCFSRNGFHNTTTADIARAAGVAQGTFYLYFPTKDDVIVALANGRRDGEALINALASAESDAIEGLRSLLDLHTQTLSDPQRRDERRVAIQAWAEGLRNEVVRRQLLENTSLVIDEIADLIRRGISDGQFKSDANPESVARALVALFRGLTVQAAWDDIYAPERLGTAVGDMLRGALLP